MAEISVDKFTWEVMIHLNLPGSPFTEQSDYAVVLPMVRTAVAVIESWCGPIAEMSEPAPEPILHAIRMYVGHLYENREATSLGSVNEMPLGFFDLIGPYRKWAFG